MTTLNILLGTLFITVSVLLILVVLLQKGRGGGLGAAFGGAGSSAFGTRTGDVFTWVTIILTAMFLLLAIGSTLNMRPPRGQVLAPKIDHTGPVDGSWPVTVTCNTLGAKIVYTTDGSRPTEEMEGTKVSATFHVKPGMTVKVRAFRKAWKPSELVEVTYEKMAAPTSKPATEPATESVTPAPAE